MTLAIPIATLIGEHLQEWRETAGLRQDDVAKAARSQGLQWTRATVAAIERGHRGVSLDEFVVLLFTVAQFPHAPVRYRKFSGFVAPRTSLRPIAVGSDAWIQDQHLQALFMGRPVGTERQSVAPAALYARPAARRAIAERVDAHFEAEIKAARRLGIDEQTLTRIALRLWGRTFTEERDRRLAERGLTASAPARTTQAVRGHITRELLAILGPKTASHRRRKDVRR